MEYDSENNKIAANLKNYKEEYIWAQIGSFTQLILVKRYEASGDNSSENKEYSTIEYEKATYDEKGLLTYVTHSCLLDILTDTTERQPTFTLPPFRKFNDPDAPISWAYIKDPLYPNHVAWQHVFRRPIKGLEWTREDYIRMNAAQNIIDNPPKVGSDQVELYNIGNEDDPSRYSRKPCKLICMDINGSANEKVMEYFNNNVGKYSEGMIIRFGAIPKGKLYKNEIYVPVKLPQTCTNLFTHLMIKLAIILVLLSINFLLVGKT